MCPSNQVYGDRCPIWPDYPGRGFLEGDITAQEWSPRTGGKYAITREARYNIERSSPQEKALLTTMLVDLRNKGTEWPEVTTQLLEEAGHRSVLSAEDRSERLLRFLANETTVSGAVAIYGPLPPKDTELSEGQIVGCHAMAWSESSTLEEVFFFLDDLIRHGLIDKPDAVSYRVTVDGRRHISGQKPNVDSKQAFIAMWMDSRMDKVYTGAIVPAVERAGYSPYRVDDEYHLDRIEEKALSEIRRSRFLVVDLTHDERGARGSVYFEAGFALGLGIPIIYCCRKDQGKDVHFDVDHHYRIEWETHEELRTKLLSAIKDVVD